MKEWFEYLSGGIIIMSIILGFHIVPGLLYTIVMGGIL